LSIVFEDKTSVSSGTAENAGRRRMCKHLHGHVCREFGWAQCVCGMVHAQHCLITRQSLKALRCDRNGDCTNDESGRERKSSQWNALMAHERHGRRYRAASYSDKSIFIRDLFMTCDRLSLLFLVSSDQYLAVLLVTGTKTYSNQPELNEALCLILARNLLRPQTIAGAKAFE